MSPAPIQNLGLEIWQNAVAEFSHPKWRKRLKGDAFNLKEWRHALNDQSQSLTGLWEAYTGTRRNLKMNLLSSKDQAWCYLAAFHLTNRARLSRTVERIQSESGNALSRLFLRSSIAINDFGCGTGAMSQALLEQILMAYSGINKSESPSKCSVVLHDAQGSLLDIARMILSSYVEPAKPQLDVGVFGSKGSIEASLDKHASRSLTFDAGQHLEILIFGYVFNELIRNPRALNRMGQTFAERIELDQKTGQGTMLVMMDPANEKQALNMMQLRDELVGLGYAVLYPCPRKDQQSHACPLLNQENNYADRCFSEFDWEMPAVVKAVDSILDVSRSRLASSAYIFGTPSVAKEFDQHELSASSHDKLKQVLVGRPTDRSNRTILLQCDGCEIKRRPMPRDSQKSGKKQFLRGSVI